MNIFKPAGAPAPRLVHQEGDEGEEEEDGDGDDAGEPLRQQTFVDLSPTCNRTHGEVKGQSHQTQRDPEPGFYVGVSHRGTVSPKLLAEKLLTSC